MIIEAIDSRSVQFRELTEEISRLRAELEEKKREAEANKRELDETKAKTVTDPLTKLLNLRGWEEQMKLYQRLVTEGVIASAAVIYLDANELRVRQKNPSLGHDWGNAFLIHMAKQIEAATRKETDVVARTGGDEFAVFLPAVDEVSAELVKERILRNLETSEFEFEGKMYGASAASGMALFPEEPFDQLTKIADKKMLTEKMNLEMGDFSI